MGHTIDDEKLTSYLLGEMEDAERREVERVLAKDKDAREALAGLESAAAIAEEALQSAVDPSLKLTEEQRSQVRQGASEAGPEAAAESSGLLDIRSLASAVNATDKEEDVDDLISMGGGDFSSALGAPVLAPLAKSEMSMRTKIGIAAAGVAFVVGVVVVSVLALSGDDEEGAPDPQLVALQQQIDLMKGQGHGGDPAELEELKKQLAAAQAANNDAPSENGDDAEEQAPSAKKKAESKAASKGAMKRSSSSSAKGSASTSKSSSVPSSKAAPAAPKSKKGGSDELDDLLGGSLAKPAKKKSASSAKAQKPSGSSKSGGVKKSLNRGDVQKGMKGVAGRVKRCGKGKKGTMTLKVVIGRTGRVISANPTGTFAGTPEGSCAARAVRSAKFPASQSNLTVSYPFKL